jgi:hypothetical protein
MMPTQDIPNTFGHEVKQRWVERGGSSIFAPDASYVVEPIYDREQLIVSDLDLGMIDRESMNLDLAGHYARPDVFTFGHRPTNYGMSGARKGVRDTKAGRDQRALAKAVQRLPLKGDAFAL